jgi:hypothetical protein
MKPYGRGGELEQSVWTNGQSPIEQCMRGVTIGAFDFTRWFYWWPSQELVFRFSAWSEEEKS